MNNLEQTLSDIGLNDKETKVYLATLELGESTVLPIAKKSGIKRTYCYDILDDLKKKNLVGYVEKNNRRQYFAEDPQKIEDILKSQLETFDKLLPELRSIYNKPSEKPRIRYFEGREGIISIYNELAKSKACDAITSPKHIMKYLGDFFIEYTQKQLAKKVKTREILTRDGIENTYVKNYKKPYQEARLLPHYIEISTDIILFENKLAMISYTGDLHAVVIESSSIVDTQKMMFEIIWRQAEEII